MVIPTNEQIEEAKQNVGLITFAIIMSQETRADYNYSLNLLARAFLYAEYCNQKVKVNK